MPLTQNECVCNMRFELLPQLPFLDGVRAHTYIHENPPRENASQARKIPAAFDSEKHTSDNTMRDGTIREREKSFASLLKMFKMIEGERDCIREEQNLQFL